MFQNWIEFLQLKCAGSALKCSETQVREIIAWSYHLIDISGMNQRHFAALFTIYLEYLKNFI